MKNILFSYPHSSLYIPEEIKERLNISQEDLVVSMDFGTDRFFSGFDTAKVFSEIHFLFGNLNRHISGNHLLTGKSYSQFNGLFPKELIHNGKPVYRESIPLSEAEKQRILDLYYISYYNKLVHFILSGKIDFVIDVHSCDPIAFGNQSGGGERADIILGNLGDVNGQLNPEKGYITFSSELLQKLKGLLESYGLSVSLNSPFAGGNITQQIGKQIPTLQIEINKRVYMSDDLVGIEWEKFTKINNILEEVFKKI